MAILRYQMGPMANNSYVIVDEATNQAAIVDPSFGCESMLADVKRRGLDVRLLLITHGHFDHIVGNAATVAEFNVPIFIHETDLPLLQALTAQAAMFGMEATASPEPTGFLVRGQTVELGDTKIEVRDTPGHAPGHVTLIVGDSAIVGDCIFRGSIGRTDLPGADHATLMRSINEQLLTLPDETIVLPGHGEPTTIGAERRTNPFLQD